MTKIVVGGQINKDEVAKLLKELFKDQADVEIKNDLEAAMDMKNGLKDYYFGACVTGGGGALAMAIALIGADKCATVSMPGNIFPDEKIIEEVNKGKTAFGFTSQHIDKVVPVLAKAILARKKQAS
ncbi:MAG: DUF2620 domain-containing protein [Elusimicrobiota bacterium]|jgi:hypothetical protein|nr:DUF2620 domain-containing protein [Elusimicrobiota bacterium]